MVKRIAIVAALLLALPSCGFVGPTADTGSIISISANPLAIGLNGAQATVTVIVSQADGNPPPNGTLVFLTTTLGTLPAEVQTSNGRATATLSSGAQSGVATVTARSGTESSVPIDILVGAVLARVVVVATPATVPTTGGESTITATALGDNDEPLANVPIIFSTTAGTLQSAGAIVRTNSSGEATDRLTTSSAATVTAASGSFSATATVTPATPNLPPVASFTSSPTAPRAGQEIFFNASASTDPDGSIVSYDWDFGDGNSGSGRETSHVYASAQSYVVVLTVTDNSAGTGSTSKTVVVSQ
jgi:chitodextrinase